MTDISELMRRDPLLLTKDDISTIIATMRSSRHQFTLGNVKAGSMKPKTAKEKQVGELAAKINLKLDL